VDQAAEPETGNAVIATGREKNLSDRQLIDRYRETQDLAVAYQLFLRYDHLILATCLKYLKDTEAGKDATRDVFLRLLDLLLREEIKSFRSWLREVVKNHCLNLLEKKERKLTIRLETEDLELRLWKFGLFSHLSNEYWIEIGNHVHAAIQELPEEQRNSIIGKYFDGKTYKEIAAEHRYPEKSIKSYIENGKRNLRIKLSHLKNRNEL
jgi:RNA polymerase sigma-70 factor (ECF subfamily)